MKSPPNPAACQPLSNEDFARLRAARPRLWTDPAKDCLTCRKAEDRTYRWYTDGDRTGTATYECDCRAQWLLHLWMLNSGIGLNYQRLSWDDISSIPANIVEQVQDYALRAAENVASGRNLILWSTGAGSGKTLLLMLLAKALLLQGIQVYVSQFNDIIDLFTSSWRDQAERDQWNRRVRNADVKCIDDLGKEHKGRVDLVDSMLDQVIRGRVMDDAPTIITTNLTPQQVQQNYGGYVMSLLSEKAIFIEVTGADFRPKRLVLSQAEFDLGLTRPLTVV